MLNKLISSASIRGVVLAAVAAVSLSACASRGYVDQQDAAINGRIDQLETRIQDATQRADAATAEARAATQRTQQLEGRVSSMQTAPAP